MEATFGWNKMNGFRGKIYVALSKIQNECTLCQRWFGSYEEAEIYRRQTEKDSGCLLYVIELEYGEIGHED